jgi:deoxyribonuclease-4
MNLGPHVSMAGGIQRAVYRQREIDGTCGQLFSTSPRVWAHPDTPEVAIERFRTATEAADIGPWIVHGAYLVNLATPDPELRDRSVESLQADVDLASELGIEFVNVHLGAHTGAGVEAGLANAAGAIGTIDIPREVTLLLETDAGAGTKLGGDLAHLETVLEAANQDLGVCLDTAHLFAAGYDLRDREAVDRTVEAVDASVGLETIRCIHLNDSRYDLGTNRDHHAHLGDGKIGEAGIAAVINHDSLRDMPFVLETPKDGIGDPGNIERVKALRT